MGELPDSDRATVQAGIRGWTNEPSFRDSTKSWSVAWLDYAFYYAQNVHEFGAPRARERVLELLRTFRTERVEENRHAEILAAVERRAELARADDERRHRETIAATKVITMPTSGEIQLSIQRFRDYANDLVRSDINTFDDALDVFVTFCESDPVFQSVHAQLISVPGADFDEWYEPLKTSHKRSGLPFPTDTEKRMALMYEMLRRLKDKRLSFREITIRHFAIGSPNVTAHIQALNDAVTQKLVRELEYRLQGVVQHLPSDQRQQVPATTIQIIHQATNVIQQNAVGSGITQIAKQSLSPELKDLFADLRREALAASKPEEKSDVEEIITSAEELASAEKPKGTAVKLLLKGLPPVASVLSIVASIVKLLT